MFLFLVTPYFVVTVHLCMEWIPIKKNLSGQIIPYVCSKLFVFKTSNGFFETTSKGLIRDTLKKPKRRLIVEVDCTLTRHLKLVSAIFYQIFVFHQIIALQKLWKKFSISPKKLFSFLRYLNFCIFVFPSFFPSQPLL